MKNNRTFIIIFFSFIGIIFLLFFYFSLTSDKYNWHESYKAESDQPYGTTFIMKMLKGYADGEFTYNTKESLHDLLDTVGQGQAYIFIGESIYLDTADKYAI